MRFDNESLPRSRACAAALAAALVLAGPVFAQEPIGPAAQAELPSFERLDRNGDGVVDESEARRADAVTVNWMRDADTNRDRRLGRREFTEYRNRQLHDATLDATPDAPEDSAPPEVYPGSAQPPSALSRLSFERLDADGDGYLSEADTERLRALTDNRFEDLDGNRDGRMSRREFETFKIREANERYRQAGPTSDS